MSILPPFADLSESDFDRAPDSESDRKIGSTLVDPLKTVPNSTRPETSDQSSVATTINHLAEPRDVSLGGRSRPLIKKHFESLSASDYHQVIH